MDILRQTATEAAPHSLIPAQEERDPEALQRQIMQLQVEERADPLCF